LFNSNLDQISYAYASLIKSDSLFAMCFPADIVLAEHGAGGDGLEFLTNLRVFHPDVIRVLALEAKTILTKQAISPAAIYQFVDVAACSH